MKRAFLVGHGISHSLSPAVYAAAFEATGVDATYDLLDVEEHELASVATRLKAPDCLGANVTMPYKFWGSSAADKLDDTARACGAVNLLVNRGGRLEGCNTDAIAIASLLRQRHPILRSGRAIVVGAGGAAAAAVWALCQVLPASLVLAARRVEAATELAGFARTHCSSLSIEVISTAELNDSQRDVRLVINATPVGMHNASEDPFPFLPVTEGSLVYDLVYRREGPTALQARAVAAGAELVDGVGHLYEQAVPTFEAFTHSEAPREPMRQAIAIQIGRDPALWAHR